MVDDLETIPDSWRVCRLDEVAIIIDSLHKTPTYSESGKAMVRVTDVQGGFLDLSKTLRVNEDVFEEFTRRYSPARGDIVFSRVGSYGNASYTNADIPYCLGQNTALISPRINGRFLHFYLQSSSARQQIENAAVGSTQKTISLKSISALQIPVPPTKELEAITHILGTLDDKIELNRQMNETLEDIARALFKSWFIDFEPVRAKAEGRNIGLPKDIADLFPDSFEDSELGEVPKGWSPATLGTVLKQRVERCVPSEETASRPYVPIDCISSKSLYLAECKSGAEAQSSLTRFYKNDLLFGAMRPYFHKVCLAPFDGTTRTTAFVLIPKNHDDFCFGTMLLHHPDTIDYATRHSTGSTIPYAVWTSSLEDMPIVMPPPPIRKAFNLIIKPIIDRIPPTFFESRNLAELRNALLPKLLSGNLTIKDAERFIREAA